MEFKVRVGGWSEGGWMREDKREDGGKKRRGGRGERRDGGEEGE